MKTIYSAPKLFITQLDSEDVIATSDLIVTSDSADNSAQLGDERGGNPIWD